jgi:hypothetical protein
MTCEPLTVERLEHWALSGAHCRVAELTSQRAVVDLCACTGEPVERLQSEDRAVIAYLTVAPPDLDLTDPG